ncbi:MAG: alpha/beta hydrolase [Bacteroidota bacterium]
MKTIQHLLVIAFLSIFVSCKKEPKETNLDATIISELSYGSDSKQKMDVYLPENRGSSTPVIVFIHGGGFVAGDKNEFSAQMKSLSAQGFAVLNVNYRLVDLDGVLTSPIVHKPSTVKIADQLNDVQAAINFAAGKAGEWNISADKWGITGHSAGGTLSLLYAYGDKNTGKRIKVAGNWAGATTFAFSDESEFKLLDPRLVEVIYRAVGAEPVNASKLAYMAVSPYWIANQSKAIATINIRPEDNNVATLPDGSKILYQQFTDVLTSKGVPNKWVEVAGADHGFSKAGNWDQVINETSLFFKSKL